MILHYQWSRNQFRLGDQGALEGTDQIKIMFAAAYVFWAICYSTKFRYPQTLSTLCTCIYIEPDYWEPRPPLGLLGGGGQVPPTPPPPR